jgi:hypothetical protein
VVEVKLAIMGCTRVGLSGCVDKKGNGGRVSLHLYRRTPSGAGTHRMGRGGVFEHATRSVARILLRGDPPQRQTDISGQTYGRDLANNYQQLKRSTPESLYRQYYTEIVSKYQLTQMAAWCRERDAPQGGQGAPGLQDPDVLRAMKRPASHHPPRGLIKHRLRHLSKAGIL